MVGFTSHIDIDRTQKTADAWCRGQRVPDARTAKTPQDSAEEGADDEQEETLRAVGIEAL